MSLQKKIIKSTTIIRLNSQNLSNKRKIIFIFSKKKYKI